MSSQTETNLFKKYDVPAPRYTSYPTVPYWTDSPTTTEWLESLRRASEPEAASLSYYLHIPFCESLCTFCGCNTTITRNHRLESPYVDRLLKEHEFVTREVPTLLNRKVRQIHLGGGTPTFLNEESLEYLCDKLFSRLQTDSGHFEGAIEIDPRRTRETQLKVLRKYGFDRVSLGVQDFDPEVQRLIHRTQPFEMTQAATESARALGYRSVNFDLIYGLPRQSLKSIDEMIKKTVQLSPDRIALYSFALVPWIKPAQRLFKDSDLPVGEEKRQLYEHARMLLLAAGYIEIGMDHFAKPTDAMATVDKLHRNFMGYSDVRTDILLGLGVSAISETPDCFHQNEKVLPKYEELIDQGQIPTLRGHKLSQEDVRQREKILNLMTEFEVTLDTQAEEQDLKSVLAEMLNDELISISDRKLKLLKSGRPFLRNACMALDLRLREKQPQAKVFSSSL